MKEKSTKNRFGMKFMLSFLLMMTMFGAAFAGPQPAITITLNRAYTSLIAIGKGLGIDKGNGKIDKWNQGDKYDNSMSGRNVNISGNTLKIYGNVTHVVIPSSGITSVVCGACPKLQLLDVRANNISEADMGKLINSLPVTKIKGAKICVKTLDTDDDGAEHNVCNTDQVAAAKKKGWMVVQSDVNDDYNVIYKPYKGVKPSKPAPAPAPIADFIKPNMYYRLQNMKNQKELCVEEDGNTVMLMADLAPQNEQSNLSSIIQFVPVKGKKGVYHLMTCGKYISRPGRSNGLLINLGTIYDAGEYSIGKMKTMNGDKYYTLQQGGRCLAIDLYAEVASWGPVPTTSYWKITPVTSFDIKMKKDNKGDCYCTLYVPFKVVLPTGLDAYALKKADKSAGVFNFDKVADVIPAQTPILLKGKAAKYTLTIDDKRNCDPIASDERFHGCLLPSNDAYRMNSYVLGIENGEAGFYHPRAGVQFKANHAYFQFPASNTASRSSFSIDLGDGVTGLSTALKNKEGDKVYYDLQGRRVLRPGKGIYILNGKKVVLQ